MSSQETLNDNDKLKTLLEHFSDYVLWGGVIFIFCCIYGYFGIYLPRSKQQTITVAFKDANEINHGSIVRMMGTEIGYVDTVQLNNDHVDVTLKTFPGAPKIPSGSTFSIKFTGLVGAKSIEVINSENPIMRAASKTPVYNVEEPIRMRESLEYQIDIAQALQRGAENFTDMFGKKKPLEEVEYNIHLAQKAVKKGDEGLIKTKNAFEKAQTDFGKELAQVNHSIGNFSVASQEAARITSGSNFQYETIEGLHNTLNGTIAVHDKLTQFKTEGKLDAFNQKITGVGNSMHQFTHQVSQSKLGKDLNKTVDNLDTFDSIMTSGQQFFSQNFTKPIASARSAINTFNQTLINWYEKLGGKNKKKGQ